MQYGIDYTFMHREAVRWQPGSTITVRIAGPGTQDRHAALASVVAELRAFTRLDLVTGEPASLIPSAVPDGQIHVRYLPVSKLADMPGQPGGRAGLGGAARCSGGCCYVSGFAIINAERAGPDATTEHALAVLRHELAHAIGLGYAARPSLHHQLTADITRYARGDQYGLALLGTRPSAGPAPAASSSHQDVMCSATAQPPDRHLAPGHRTESPWASPQHPEWCFA